MMDGVWNKEKNGVRVDISKALPLFQVNINDSCSIFHQKLIQNPMLVEKMLHLERHTLMSLLNQKVATATAIHILKAHLCLLIKSFIW